MAMNSKKGIFYMYVSSIILVIIVFIALSHQKYDALDKQEVYETRINTVNDFIKDLEFDSKRSIYVSGFRSLIALEDYVAKSGRFLNNTNEEFRLAFFNGTVNGTAVEILQNSSYSYYLQSVRALSAKTGIDLDINVTNITLYQNSPWEVIVIVNARVKVNDTKGLATWDFTKDYVTTIPLQNIRDPIYSVYTYGKIPNTIRETNITNFVNDALNANDTENLQIQLNNSYYIQDSNAPSYLMRLAGNFSNSTYGISSLVHMPDLDTQGVVYDSSKSVVDYVLFTNVTGYNNRACNIQNMPSWFKIDLNHTAVYEIDELNYTVC